MRDGPWLNCDLNALNHSISIDQASRRGGAGPFFVIGKKMLFTNAGMVQFKDLFLGQEKRDYVRATTSQRCVRAGGKHNDLENVGYTARHHTFFEMLGNFSFGDYFKEQAIHFAWDFLTGEQSAGCLGLDKDKLWITVFEEDDEAFDIWENTIGVPKDRIARIGAKDNFWQMGDTGPCGPCSEIFYDHGPDVWGGPPGTPEEDGDRYIEIWNLVFMQYDRSADGTLTPLPKPSVDTGMGLERIAAVLQGVHSNYEIDLFERLLAATATCVGSTDHGNASLKVIADHIRSCAFMIVDGVVPGNEGRGYVLRRIIRRAIRHGYKLGCERLFFSTLVPALIAEMGEAYPELVAKQERVERAHVRPVSSGPITRFAYTATTRPGSSVTPPLQRNLLLQSCTSMANRSNRSRPASRAPWYWPRRRSTLNPVARLETMVS